MRPQRLAQWMALSMAFLAALLLYGCGSSSESRRGNLQATQDASTLALAGTPTATLTGPELDATKEAPWTPAAETVVAAATQYAIATPLVPTFEPLPTSPPTPTPNVGYYECTAEHGFSVTSCWVERVGDQYELINTGFRSYPTWDGWKDNKSQPVLRVSGDTLAAAQYYTMPVSPPDITIADAIGERVTIIGVQDSGPNPVVTFNLLTRSWEEPGPCRLYPIGLSTATLAGLQAHFGTKETTYGPGPGAFGWLNWDPAVVTATLASGLTRPGNSYLYSNPNNPADHIVSVGDWVAGRQEITNDAQAAEALRDLADSHIRFTVPLWDEVRGQGESLAYHVAGFAWVSLDGASVGPPNELNVRYWGQAACPGAP